MTTPPTPDAGRARTIIEKWRAEMPHLVQPESWMQPMIALLDAYDAMADERNGLAFAQQHLTAQLAAAKADGERIVGDMKDAAWLLLHASKQSVPDPRSALDVSCKLTEHCERLDAALAVQP